MAADTELENFRVDDVVGGTYYLPANDGNSVQGGLFVDGGYLEGPTTPVTWTLNLATPISAKYVGMSLIYGNQLNTEALDPDSVLTIVSVNGLASGIKASSAWVPDSQITNGLAGNFRCTTADLGSVQQISNVQIQIASKGGLGTLVLGGFLLSADNPSVPDKLLPSDPGFIQITSIKDDAAPYQIVTDGGTWNNGDVISVDTTAATGIVGSTDPDSNTMTLSSSDESGTKRWIVDGGRKVTMDAKPAVKTTGYLEWSGTQVTGIVSADPGYKPADPSLQLTFTDPSPTGESWDTDLPTGTTIKTRVLATNDNGTADSGWSNTVVGYGLSIDLADEEYPKAYLESASHIATFTNRAEVYQGQQAQQKREALNEKVAANLGISTAELEELVGEET